MGDKVKKRRSARFQFTECVHGVPSPSENCAVCHEVLQSKLDAIVATAKHCSTCTCKPNEVVVKGKSND